MIMEKSSVGPPRAVNPGKSSTDTLPVIFLLSVWVYILLFVFLGPEMTQEERDEENAVAQELERMRAEGISLAEIGASRAKGVSGFPDVAHKEKADEKDVVRYIEEA